MAGTDRRATDWVSVYRDLRHDIDAGVYAPGQKLPTISALARAADLSQHGARRAMERLCAEQRAQSWQGKGFRVAMPRIRLRLDVKTPVFGDSVRAQGYVAASEVVSGTQRALPHSLAKRMRCKPGLSVLSTETVRRVNDCAVALSIDYFRRDRLDGVIDTIVETGSVSRALAQHGVTSYQRDHTSYETRLPTAHEALLLGIPRQQPVYVTVGANVAEDGTVVQLSKGVWRGDCVIYQI